MKTYFVRLFTAFFLVVTIAGCKEKKEDNVIITSIPKEVVRNDTTLMDELATTKQVTWRGSEYTVEVIRHADKSLALAEDEGGHLYYDNHVTLAITRHDGTEFLRKKFVKADFKDKVSEEFYENKALVGFVFDKVDGSNLRFAASIGSPDKFSDDFIPFDVLVSPSGDISIKLSEQNLVDSSKEEETV